jgi:hypothetical protein
MQENEQKDERASGGKKRTGFAAMTPEQRARISQMGGKAAHATGRGRVFTSEEARLAGAKGGRAAAARAKTRNSEPPVTDEEK